jgi:hypothetical protein
MHNGEKPEEFLQQLADEALENKQQKLRIVQWVAESPTHAAKTARKNAAVEFLNLSRRTFERWLHYQSRGCSTPPPSGQANLSFDDWQSFILAAWREERLNGDKASPFVIYQLVQAEAQKRRIDRYPSYATVRRFLNSLSD